MPLRAVANRLVRALEHAGVEAEFGAFSKNDLWGIQQVLPLSVELLDWYGHQGPVSLYVPWYAQDLRYYTPTELVEWQAGYRWRAGVPSDMDPHWRAHWIVIGDWGGDPIIAHTDKTGTPISTAIHGIGTWELYEIAPSLEDYLKALAIWVEVCLWRFEGSFCDDNCELLHPVRAELESQLAEFLTPEHRKYWLTGEIPGILE